MKNIHEILAALGVDVPADKKAELDKELLANYKTVADYEKQATSLQQARESLKTAQDGLKAFEGVDVKDLQGQIGKLKSDLEEKDRAHAKELAERDFSARLDAAIGAKKGRSAKAIKAMMDLDALRGSKDPDKDIPAALDALAKESGYLFESAGTPPPYAGATGTQPPAGGPDGALRAAMGLPPENTK